MRRLPLLLASLLAGLLCALVTACPPSSLVGQPCAEAGLEQCEDTSLLRCDGQFFRKLAECSSECIADLPPVEHTEATIAASETWRCADGPHVVGTTITVGAGATLTLEAGALLRLVPAARVVTDPAGRIDSLGTAEAPVFLTSDNGQKGGYGAGGEGGLNVFAVEEGEPSRIEHTIIEFGIHGLGVFGLSSTATPPVVENNAFRDNEQYGITITCNEDAPPIPDFLATNQFFGNGLGEVSPCPAPPAP